jgi:hypothetical protein
MRSREKAIDSIRCTCYESRVQMITRPRPLYESGQDSGKGTNSLHRLFSHHHTRECLTMVKTSLHFQGNVNYCSCLCGSNSGARKCSGAPALRPPTDVLYSSSTALKNFDSRTKNEITRTTMGVVNVGKRQVMPHVTSTVSSSLPKSIVHPL